MILSSAARRRVLWRLRAANGEVGVEGGAEAALNSAFRYFELSRRAGNPVRLKPFLGAMLKAGITSPLRWLAEASACIYVEAEGRAQREIAPFVSIVVQADADLALYRAARLALSQGGAAVASGLPRRWCCPDAAGGVEFRESRRQDVPSRRVERRAKADGWTDAVSLYGERLKAAGVL